MKGVAALANHIASVIKRGATKEMVGVYAQTVVTMMTDKHTFGDGAAMQLPRKPVYELVVFLVNHHGPIPSTGLATRPFPAIVGIGGDVHPGPEPFFGRMPL